MRHTNWEKTATVFRGRKSFFPHTSSFAVWTLVTLALLLLTGLASVAGLSLSSAPQASAVTTVPTKLNFQGRLSDSAGSIKPNGTYNMKFKLYTVATAGTAVWSEDRLVSATQGVTVTNGLFSVQLGSITSLPASLFASGALYLEVELPTPATATSTTPTWTEGPMTPRNQMATSAYAYNSETLDGQDGAWYQDAANLTGTVSAARLSGSYTGITGTGALAVGSIASGFGTIVTGNTIQGTQLISTVAVGTAPLIVTSTTKVTNLNADLLDGYDSSSLTVRAAQTADDITLRTDSGFYQSSTATIAEGYPVDSNGWYHLLSSTHSNTANYYAMQFSGSFFNSNDIFYRSTNGSGTTAWNRIWHQGNDGAGSGLDADTLDGLSSASFASTTSNNTWTGTNLFKPSTDSTTALQIQNSSSASLLTANTTNMRLSVAGSEVIRSADYSVSYVPTFSTKTDYTTGAGPQEVTSADFNADGKFDIAAVNYSSNTISVFINNGSGTFAAKVDYATGSLPSSIISGDFNADGKPDIAATNSNAASFSVFINNGNGTFAAKVDYATDQTPISLAAGDYSGDGKLDIVVASSYISGIDYVSKYTNNGNGTFAARVDVASGNSSPYEVVLGDINKDGLKDIITAGSNLNGGNNISYYRNTGGGSFAAAVDYAVLSVGNIAVADINNDTYDDVIAGAGANISILKNNGAGSLSQRTDISSWVSIQKITTTDINGDGFKDIVLVDNHGGNSSASSISVILNNGDGTYASKTNFGVGIAPLSATMADFNADSIPDAAVVNSYNGVGGNSVSVLFNQTLPKTSQSATGTLSVRTTAAGAGGLYIQGTTGQTASLLAIQDSTGAGLFVVDAYGSVRAKGAIQGGVGSPDYAENITASDPTIQPADVVAIDPANREHVIKSSQPYQATALGVISTSPGFVTNATAPDADDGTQRPLALSGRVPVKVTNENGVIQPGDHLTTSSTPGYAMKATQAGPTIGRAMEGFDGESGKVLMFIDNSYYNPYGGQNIQGSNGVFASLVVSGQIQTKELVVEGNSTFEGSITVKGHVVSGGETPQTQLGVALGGTDNSQVQLSLEGNDTSGEITIVTGSDGQSYATGDLLKLTFNKVFTKVPRIMLSASNEHAVRAEVFVTERTREGFMLRTLEPLAPNTTYMFTYWAVE